MLRIVCAANRLTFENGESLIVCGVRHYDLIMHRLIEIFDEEPNVVVDQGFVDNKGKFLSREEAFTVAKEANQIISNPNSTKLFSEDLY